MLPRAHQKLREVSGDQIHSGEEAEKMLQKGLLLFVVIVQGAHLEPSCHLKEMFH